MDEAFGFMTSFVADIARRIFTDIDTIFVDDCR
jgi:hypothetical protein